MVYEDALADVLVRWKPVNFFKSHRKGRHLNEYSLH